MPALETKRQRLDRLYAQLELERASFISHWRSIADVLLPTKARFQLTEINRGDRKNTLIIRNIAGLALRTLKYGMMSGLTSPARPWFKLTTTDPRLAEFGPVKLWLETVTSRMVDIFLKSNLYSQLPALYTGIGGLGTAAMSVNEDAEDFIRCYAYPMGSFMLALNDRLSVDTFVREYRLTVRQLIQRFGGERGRPISPGQNVRWGNFSTMVRSLWDAANYEAWIDVIQVVRPNDDFNPNLADSRFKRLESIHYEKASRERENMFLRESGFDLFPILGPRWEVTGEDVYGTNCPGMEALGDILELQFVSKRKKEAIDKMVRPPMIAPTHLRNQKTSILPGDITYADTREGMKGFRPVFEVDPKLQDLTADIGLIEQIINETFYKDLFRRILDDYRNERATATEIRAMTEEKLLALGPVLEQLNQDAFDPLIDLTFGYMVKASGENPDDPIIPTPPEDLQGTALKVEYISILAQAQKAVGVTGIERTAAFVRGLSEANPAALDKFDDDEAIDIYSDMVGVSPRAIRTDEAVQALREERQRLMEEERRAAMAQQGARAARDLAGADMEGDNALTRLTGAGAPA